MKRILSSVLIMAMVLCLFAGCKSNTGAGEESAEVGDLVSGSAQDNVEDSDGPQKVENSKNPSVDKGNANQGNTNGGNVDNTNDKENTNDKDNIDNTDNNSSSNNSDDFEGVKDEEEVVKVDPEDKSFGYIKVLCYNLRGMRNGPTVNGERTDVLRRDDLAEVIKEIDADIVGVQETENFRKRSGNFEQLPWLAEQCGYNYYYYVQTYVYSDGKSSAGHGIMSKYPIVDVEEVVYDAQGGSASSGGEYGRFVLDVDGTNVVMYNTHLLAGDSSNVNSIAARQFKQVLNAFYAETGPALLTGDFNLKLPIMEQLVDKSKLISMNGGLDWLTINSKASIDNIYVRNVEPYFPESKPGLYVGEKMGKQLENAWPSDHNPIWAYFKIKKY